MRNSRILGIGSYTPSEAWSNEAVLSLGGNSAEGIHADFTPDDVEQRTGIKTRHWVSASSGGLASDIGLEAAKKAIESAGIQKEDLDMILFCTLTPDHEFPGTGCFFQEKLGVPGIPVIDIKQACSGFLYALSVADQFIKTNFAKRILIVAGETYSVEMRRRTHGKSVTALFGDGGGAVVVGQTGVSHEGRIISTHLHADGSFAKELWFEHGTEMTQMNGKLVYTHACKNMAGVINEMLYKNDLRVSEIDFFAFHQANLRINDMVAQKLEIPSDKILNTIQRFGNTGSASIPIGLDEAVKAGRLKPGMLVASAAFGSGFTWASALIRW